MTDVKPDLKKAFGDVMSKMGGFTVQESSFNEAIGQSSYLPVGEHLATVQSAEIVVGNFGPQIEVVWASTEGATIKQYVSMIQADEKTGETKFSRAYLSLMQAMIADLSTKLSYAEEIPKQAGQGKTTLVDALVGCKATIVVAKGKKGYEIIQDNGSFHVKDVADGTVLIESPFQSLSDAAKMAKEEGFKRAYNRVNFVKPSKEEQPANETALKAVLAKSKAK